MTETPKKQPDIEITPEMIEAGIIMDRQHDWRDLGGEEERIRDIFAAMWAEKPANFPH